MRKEELYTFICAERDFTAKIPNLTWQQTLIEKSRKSWEYSDLLPAEMRDSDHVIAMLDSVIQIEKE